MLHYILKNKFFLYLEDSNPTKNDLNIPPILHFHQFLPIIPASNQQKLDYSEPTIPNDSTPQCNKHAVQISDGLAREAWRSRSPPRIVDEIRDARMEKKKEKKWVRERERGGEKTESGQSPDAARAQVCHRLYGKRHDTGINVPPYRYRYNMQMRWCTHTWGEPASSTARNNTPVSNTCCSGRGRRRHRERRDHRSRSVQLTVDFCFRSEDLYSEAGPAVIFLACLALPPPCFATRPYPSLSLSFMRVCVWFSREIEMKSASWMERVWIFALR